VQNNKKGIDMTRNLSVAVLSVLITVSTQAISVFEDDFSGANPKAEWTPSVSGTGVNISQTGGQLWGMIAANAAPLSGSGTLSSGFRLTGVDLTGDFSAEVSFSLGSKWDPQNEIRVGIGATVPGTAPAQRAGFGGQDNYVSDFNGAVNALETSDLGGKLKVARVGDVMSGSYWTTSGWVVIGSSTVDPDATVNLAIGLWGHPLQNGRTADTSISFDDFSVVYSDRSESVPDAGSSVVLLGIALTVLGVGSLRAKRTAQAKCKE